MIVKDVSNREFQLTREEIRVLRALDRLQKMNFGRLRLFANGIIDVRINGRRSENLIATTSILCDGGDGGD
jgi:putative component of toxin-antitoxin plasmid stabilization module